jgi:hypothetical protein
MIKQLLGFLFGEPRSGEPIGNIKKRFDVRGDEGFFEWCQEFNVGCRTKNCEVFY